MSAFEHPLVKPLLVRQSPEDIDPRVTNCLCAFSACETKLPTIKSLLVTLTAALLEPASVRVPSVAWTDLVQLPIESRLDYLARVTRALVPALQADDAEN